MRILYFDCSSGISGDMVIGALLGVGLDLATLRGDLAKLKLKGFEIQARKVKRSGISGTKFDVIIGKGAKGFHMFGRIKKLINQSGLSVSTKKLAVGIFEKLAQAEAEVHGETFDKTYLHEVGDLDSIIDVVGAAIGINRLGIEKVYASSVLAGRGWIKVPHGIPHTHKEIQSIPLPSPAALYLLKGRTVNFDNFEGEFVTPTGAAILATLAEAEYAPPMQIKAIGYGAGGRDIKGHPNLLRAILGESKTEKRDSDRVMVLETNVDDMSPQLMGCLHEKLFGDGALDVFLTNILMKKSRPGWLITVLVKPHLMEKVASRLFQETTTTGLRFYETSRWKLSRKTVCVKTRWGKVRIKVAEREGKVTFAPEYADCLRVSKKYNEPLNSVMEEVRSKASGI